MTKVLTYEEAQLMFIENVYPHADDELYCNFDRHIEMDEFLEDEGYQYDDETDTYIKNTNER